MSILINIVLLTVTVTFVKYAYAQDHCPAPPSIDSLCEYTPHKRDCQHDIYMSLCTITNPVNTTDDMWEFMCSDVNFCLGCRYCYTHCYTGQDEVASHSCGDEQLATMLGWYDALTMGGKFVLCDKGNATVRNTLKGQTCLSKNKDALDNCSLALQNTIWEGFNSTTDTLQCNDMNARFNCFLDILELYCPGSVISLFTDYFDGIVSMSPCGGGASGLLASGLMMLLSMTFLAIANY